MLACLDGGAGEGVEGSCEKAVFATPPFVGAKALIIPCTGDAFRVAYFEIDDGRPDN